MADLANLTYAISFAVQNNPFGQINNNIQQMQRNLNNASGAANNAARATGNIGQNAQNSTSPIKSLGKAIAGAFVTKKIIDFGKSMVTTGIEGAASLEQYRNTLNVVMGDQKKAAETFKWAVDFANKTPFETDEIVQATVKLQSYGITAQENMSIIGDMAGVMGKSLDQAVAAVADAQTGELERLKEFGITKQQIIDHGNKIMRGKEIVNNKGQITDQKSFNKVLFDLMQKRFKGGMELQANSFKGIMSTISGVFKTSLSKMMGISDDGEVKIGGMFDTIKNQAKFLSDKLQAMADDGTFERWGNNIKQAFDAIAKAFGWVIDHKQPVVDAINYIGDITKKTFNWIVDHKGEVTAAIVGVGTAFVTAKAIMIGAGLVGVVKDIFFAIQAVAGGSATFMEGLAFVTGERAAMLFKVGLVAGIVAALAIVAYEIYKHWDGVKAATETLVENIAILFYNMGIHIGNIFKSIGNFFIDNVVNPIIDGINEIPFVELERMEKLTMGTRKEYGSIIQAFKQGEKTADYEKQMLGLANGGITTGPTRALIGEGKEQEAVLPLSRLENLMNTGSVDGTSNTNNRMNFSPTINISVNAGADANGTAIAVKKAVQDAVDEMFSTVNLQLGYTNI